MLSFKPLDKSDIKKYAHYYKGNGVCICDKTLACKNMWTNFRSEISESDGCLIIKNQYPGFGTAFDFPILKDGGNIEAAFEKIEEYCMENGIRLQFCSLDKNEAETVMERYPLHNSKIFRNYSDYIYYGKDLRLMSGKRYSGQRNHINKFKLSYPDAYFTIPKNEDKNKILAYMSEWKKAYLYKKDSSAAKEFKMAYKFLESIDLEDFCTACVYDGDKIISFCLGEIVRDTLVIHIEKSMNTYPGVNVFMINNFAKTYPTEYINREDDSGEKGLRIAKTQLHPICKADKYMFVINSELSVLRNIPTIKTERLTLGKLTESDAADYYRLCVDDEANKYWGYDYKKDLKTELYEKYFYDTAIRDWKNRSCLVLAIRCNGVFAGETVLFDFNNRGSCKLGVRILKEFYGNGYGKEAFYATLEWALYELGMSKVLSSCYKENIPSLKMHLCGMQKVGEDEEKIYFERQI